MATGNGKKKRPGGNNGGGARKIEIDWKRFEAYCAMQCTQREIADAFNCSEDTVAKRVKENYNCGFKEIFKRKRQVGLMSLRHSLFEQAKTKGNVTIFCAKNWLGMVDKVEIGGVEGAPINIEITVGSEASKKIAERILSGEGT